MNVVTKPSEITFQMLREIMRFCYTNDQGEHLLEKHTFLSTNGRGGYCSVSGSGSVTRCDQGILVSAVRAPDLRVVLAHRLRETLTVQGSTHFLSAQRFAGETPDEIGVYHTFEFDRIATWRGEVDGVSVTRQCAMEYGENSTAVCYEVENPTEAPTVLTVQPMLKFGIKEEARQQRCDFTYDNGRVEANGLTMYVHTNGSLERTEPRWETLSYPEDAKDGRPDSGLAWGCFQITLTVPARETASLWIVFSQEERCTPAEEILEGQRRRLSQLAEHCGLRDPLARQLAMAADAYIAHRDSTGGKTILAGYPLFSDWGRDTMIALRGCCLAAGRYEDAKSILRTFLAYEKDGLMPNLFPEGGEAPLYNTVDAALLFIDGIWQYYSRTQDLAFVKEAFPGMAHIIASYEAGTKHGIGMDSDGLIFAGEGLDQVTWMDVRVNDILPTPRHGKPVEVNAYWYNALRIMAALSEKLGTPNPHYAALAEKVKESFVKAFYLPERGYLKDVISGTKADEQIRCNQIWAVSMAFSMLSREQARSVVDTVQKHLYTPCGLRSLSPEDPEYHPHYGGPQLQRDLAYHQGTTWVFPAGAYYLAYLKTHGSSKEAAQEVRRQLAYLPEMLKEGCAGQLPEIYDGDHPSEGKGCFAQAWSVGEILMVLEALETIQGQ